ncbi:MAG: Lrp/AsnC family transcriptional regulator [Flavobacteriales bacterium]|nr:Lrp/AsnC family transcriptional regulator [Flavobacteriales bacterium]
MKIDKIDLKILKELQENSKITNIELSKKIGLSAAPTLGRVQKLEKSGLIQSYHAQVNKEMVGLGFSALIQVSLTRQISNAMQNFIKQINEIESVVECYQLTGNFDYQLKVVVPDIPAFDRLITDRLSKIEEIRQMQTMVVLSCVKSSPILPINYKAPLTVKD